LIWRSKNSTRPTALSALRSTRRSQKAVRQGSIDCGRYRFGSCCPLRSSRAARTNTVWSGTARPLMAVPYAVGSFRLPRNSRRQCGSTSSPGRGRGTRSRRVRTVAVLLDCPCSGSEFPSSTCRNSADGGVTRGRAGRQAQPRGEEDHPHIQIAGTSGPKRLHALLRNFVDLIQRDGPKRLIGIFR
jgi:hypothetical protein